jgi:tetratricopeptide (TPR) repeat protein
MQIGNVVLSTLSLTLVLRVAPLVAQDDTPGLLMKADQLMRRHRPAEAVEIYKKANDGAGGKCAECIAGMAEAFNEMGAFKPAVEWSQKLVDLDASLEMTMRGYREMGVAHMKKPGDDPKTLAAAEAAFRKTLELSQGRYNDGRFALGILLLRQKREDEARAFLEEFVAKDPHNAKVSQAKQMLARPECGREECAPEFSIVTTDGDYVTQDSLKGKVTLLHFFLTTDSWQDEMWPGMKRLALWTKKADSPVQIFSISGDLDEERTRAFARQHGIAWPVGFDEKMRARQAFQVNWFPYQILINHEGKVVYRRLNWSTDQANVLSQEISIAVGALKKAQKADKKDDKDAK